MSRSPGTATAMDAAFASSKKASLASSALLSAVSSLGSAGEFSTTFVDAGLRISRGGWPLEELRVFEKVVNCFDGEDADECELEGIGQTGAEESEVDWTSMSLADEDIPDG